MCLRSKQCARKQKVEWCRLKSQLISKYICSVLKSSINRPEVRIIEVKSIFFFVHFLKKLETPKTHFEITRPLKSIVFKVFFYENSCAEQSGVFVNLISQNFLKATIKMAIQLLS